MSPVTQAAVTTFMRVFEDVSMQKGWRKDLTDLILPIRQSETVLMGTVSDAERTFESV